MVSSLSNIDPDRVIKFEDQLEMLAIMSAMTVVECGKEFDPQENSAMWDALYKGYVMTRDNRTDFETIEDAK